MTATATSATLDPSLLLASGVSGNFGDPAQVAEDSHAKRANVNKSPLAVALTPGAAGIFPRGDPWAEAAAQLPAVPAGIPFTAAPSAPLVAPPGGSFPEVPNPVQQAGLSLDQMRGLLRESEGRVTTRFDEKIDGLANRMGERLDTVETTQKDHGTKLDDLNKYNDVQDQRVAELAKQMSALCRSGSAPAFARLDPDNDKKAFLGGFPQKTGASIKTAAEDFVGNPKGLVKVEAFGNVSNGAVIEFASAEAMNRFVTDNEPRAKDAGRFLKPNRAPPSHEERNRRSLIWQGKQKLIAKGVPKDDAIFSRGRFWIAQPSGEVQEVGKIEGETIIWNEAAPEGVAGA